MAEPALHRLQQLQLFVLFICDKGSRQQRKEKKINEIRLMWHTKRNKLKSESASRVDFSQKLSFMTLIKIYVHDVVGWINLSAF